MHTIKALSTKMKIDMCQYEPAKEYVPCLHSEHSVPGPAYPALQLQLMLLGRSPVGHEPTVRVP